MKRKLGFAAATAALTLACTGAAIAQGYGHGDWGWGHMIFGGIMMVLFWGGVIALIILLVRWLGSSHGQSFTGGNGQRSSARHILDERFARGEIDREEYEERRRALDQ